LEGGGPASSILEGKGEALREGKEKTWLRPTASKKKLGGNQFVLKMGGGKKSSLGVMPQKKSGENHGE